MRQLIILGQDRLHGDFFLSGVYWQVRGRVQQMRLENDVASAAGETDKRPFVSLELIAVKDFVNFGDLRHNFVPLSMR